MRHPAENADLSVLHDHLPHLHRLLLHLHDEQRTASGDARRSRRPRQHLHHPRPHTPPRCLPDLTRRGPLYQPHRGATGHPEEQNLRLPLYPQGNHRRPPVCPTAQGVVLLQQRLLHRRSPPHARPQDHHHPRLRSRRTSHHAGPRLYRPPDQDLPPAHCHRPPCRRQSLDQLQRLSLHLHHPRHPPPLHLPHLRL